MGHADDGVPMPVQDQGLTDDSRVGPVLPLPVPVAQHDDVVGPLGYIVLGQDRSAQGCPHAQGREVGPTHHLPQDAGDLAVPLYLAGCEPPEAQLGEHLPGPLPHIQVVRVGEGGIGEHVDAQVDFHDLFRVLVGKNREQESLDESEDCGVGTDTHCEGNEGDGGEAWTLSNPAERVAEVFQEGVHALSGWSGNRSRIGFGND